MAGVDSVLPDFLKNLGPRGRDWLAALFTKIISSCKLPKIWRKSKVIAILKPGKPTNNPKGYRPIALLCTTYKLLEQMLLTRLAPYFERAIPPEQGETSFEHDFLVESGEQTNGTGYREVRQYCTDHHLVRFYFLTRVYSEYVESVLSDFQAGPQPDVLIINSCIWDISRYGSNSMREYKSNLKKFFSRLDNILLPECLVIWNLAMPLSSEINGGFLTPKVNPIIKQIPDSHRVNPIAKQIFLHHLGLGQKLPFDVIAANFYSATMADSYKFDVLDLHYHFRFELQNRVKDGIHWNPIAHRQISNLLLSHIAEAWSVEVPSVKPVEGR
ncbi:PC-esterase domain-containing protein 1A [Latimeria chalumnae]|uniref:PC-esterase domain-containing protein 1A n=1 Tax=Latimeria chalumnae TaxID=7897 RepID=UPI00313AABAC